MNAQSHRRLALDEAMRDRIKLRVELAQSQAMQDEPTSNSGAPTPDDDCTCPLCTLRRRIGMPRMDGASTLREIKIGEGESLADALRRAADEMAAEVGEASKNTPRH